MPLPPDTSSSPSQSLGSIDTSTSSSGGSRSRRGSSSSNTLANSLLKIQNAQLKVNTARAVDPLKYGLTVSKLQSGMKLASDNLAAAHAQAEEQAKQIGQQIYMMRGQQAASGAGTSPMAQFQIAQAYTKLIDLNRKLAQLDEKTYIQNALANQQLQLAANQYLWQTIGVNQAAGAAQMPAQGGMFGG